MGRFKFWKWLGRTEDARSFGDAILSTKFMSLLGAAIVTAIGKLLADVALLKSLLLGLITGALIFIAAYLAVKGRKVGSETIPPAKPESPPSKAESKSELPHPPESMQTMSTAGGALVAYVTEQTRTRTQDELLEGREVEIAQLKSDLKTCENVRKNLFVDLTTAKSNCEIKDEKITSLQKQVEQSINENEELRGKNADLEFRVNELLSTRRELKKQMSWLKFIHEETPRVLERLGRIPIASIQYYTGQQNYYLANRVAGFFKDAKWETGEPIEVSSTNLSNFEIGKRIMLTYRQSDIATFHGPTELVEHASFFEPEEIVRSINEGSQEADLLVTIFPKDFWK